MYAIRSYYGTPSVERSDSSINNDSGLGLTDRSGKGDSKNESSSTDDTANFVRDEFGTQQKCLSSPATVFVTFVRSNTGTQNNCIRGPANS
uniref:Uncharacterized protein n=1 Tax=Globodera pallida TaxID=36090 RepID=A0A183CGR1_GLOPA